MAALDGSYKQKFTNRQAVPLTLPVMEPKDSGYRKERLRDEPSRESHSKEKLARPSSRQKQSSSQVKSRSPESVSLDCLSSGGAIERPSSALARGVKIIEHSEPKVNPEPQVPEEAEVLLEEYLSPRKLRALTGQDNLEEVEYLEMKVDTRDTSLGNFGSHLPSLTQLKLSNSIISTVRDLGSCLDELKVLWMARSAVEDLDGLPAMTSLQELYLAYNEISDISPCSMLDCLQILDLEGNNIDSTQQIHYLSLCSALQSLTLEGNPVCVTASPDEADPTYNYRATVKSIIPHLKTLDEEALKEHELQRSSTGFEEDWRLIEEMMDEGLVVGAEESIELELPARPGTGIRPTTSYRPGSALKPYTSLRPGSGRPGTGSGKSGRPGSGRPGSGRPGSSRPGSSRPLSQGERLGSGGSGGSSRPGTAKGGRRPKSGDDVDEDLSGLTQGGVICGNPSKALRSRRRNKPSTLRTNPKLLEHLPDTADLNVGNPDLGDDNNMKEIMAEVSQWRQEHHKRREEITLSRAPQILTINHDEAEEVSGNEVSTEESEDEGLNLLEDRSETPLEETREKELIKAFRGARPKIKDPREASKRFTSPASMRRMRQTFEESIDAQDDDYSPTNTPPTPPDNRILNRNGSHGSRSGLRLSSPLQREAETPPDSGYHSQRKPKYTPSMKEPKVIDRSANPVIRASTLTPERTPDSPIVAPSKSGIKQPQLTKIRKGQLANVQLLPSRFPRQREDDTHKS